jgi:hypothetical protein
LAEGTIRVLRFNTNLLHRGNSSHNVSISPTQFSQQPLVPIGCAATAYFLASGIKSFRDRDPVKSQRMMKARVMAQFATLMCFIGYLGVEKLDFRIAPMYQDAKKAQAQQGQDGSAE